MIIDHFLTTGRAGQYLSSAIWGPLQFAHLAGPSQLECPKELHCLHLCSEFQSLASWYPQHLGHWDGLGCLMICRASELVPKSLKGRVGLLKETTMVPVGAGLSILFLDQETLVGNRPITDLTSS